MVIDSGATTKDFLIASIMSKLGENNSTRVEHDPSDVNLIDYKNGESCIPWVRSIVKREGRQQGDCNIPSSSKQQDGPSWRN